MSVEEEDLPTQTGSPPDEKPKLRVVDTDSTPESSEEGGWPHTDRRSGEDRRYGPTRSWDSLRGFRRRREGRRLGERNDIYVDHYSRADVALILGIFILNILDAFFTLRWLDMGGTEGNPLMDALIQTNNLIFLFQKCVVVGIWLIILVIHKNFRIARYGLWCALVLYGFLLVYHFLLHTVGPPPVPPLDPTVPLAA